MRGKWDHDEWGYGQNAGYRGKEMLEDIFYYVFNELNINYVVNIFYNDVLIDMYHI